jgi:mRNA-degrading endonuclease RelE of RelBE toxin-antitoxin system
MRYELVYNKAFANQLQLLPGYIRSIARRQIADLGEDPRPTGSKELEGHPGYYRI